MKIELINKKFGSYAKRLLKVRWLALLVFALAIAGGIAGLKHLVVETSFDNYFVEGDPMLIKTDEFKSHFGNDYFIGVLTECDNHFTPRSLDDWVDNNVAQSMLRLGTRSLQTMRSSGKIGYSIIDGKVFYPMSEIDRILIQSYTKDG